MRTVGSIFSGRRGVGREGSAESPPHPELLYGAGSRGWSSGMRTVGSIFSGRRGVGREGSASGTSSDLGGKGWNKEGIFTIGDLVELVTASLIFTLFMLLSPLILLIMLYWSLVVVVLLLLLLFWLISLLIWDSFMSCSSLAALSSSLS